MQRQMIPSDRHAYIELIKRSVTNYLYVGGGRTFDRYSAIEHHDATTGEWQLGPLARPMTLLSREQLDLVEYCVRHIAENNVPGDLMEAGVWRGGVIILLRALLDAYALAGRQVVAADSFAGIPIDREFAVDPVNRWPDRWIATLPEVKANIDRFGLLDGRVSFLPGLFEETLGGLQAHRFALVRLDSDSYASTRTSLDALYPLVSPGGIVLIDDWHLVGCRLAVQKYRAHHRIAEPLTISAGNAWWIKAD